VFSFDSPCLPGYYRAQPKREALDNFWNFWLSETHKQIKALSFVTGFNTSPKTSLAKQVCEMDFSGRGNQTSELLPSVTSID
jgi:hypothetical protein